MMDAGLRAKDGSVKRRANVGGAFWAADFGVIVDKVACNS